MEYVSWRQKRITIDKASELALKHEASGDSSAAILYWVEVAETCETILQCQIELGLLITSARAHYALGNYDRCVEFYSLAESFNNKLAKTHPWALVYQCLAYLQLGREDEAQKRMAELTPEIGPIYEVLRSEINGTERSL